MWTRLFRPGAQSTRPDHNLDHETSPTHTKRLFIAASAFFLDLSSSSVLKISLAHLSLSSSLPPYKVASLYPAPPKPPLDQERLQLIALSCIRTSRASTRGVLFVQPSGELCSTSSLSAGQELGLLCFCLGGTPVEYNRYSCWSGGCIYTKKDITLRIEWILSGITISDSTWKTTG